MDLSTLRHAFVTGGASGIGLGIADALAKRGLKVTLADVNAQALAAALADRGPQFRGAALDVRDRAQWQAAKQQAAAAFGPVDLLVNNAGIAPDGRDLADSDPESFERIIAINLMGVYNGIHTFAAGLRAAGHGYILNVASMAGLMTAVPGCGAYSAAKFAVVSLSENLRSELSKRGVGVSVFCPGLVQTNLAANTLRVGGLTRSGSADMPNGGLDAAKAGEMAVRGIERNAIHILTDFDRFEPVLERFRVLQDAFRAGMDADLA